MKRSILLLTLLRGERYTFLYSGNRKSVTEHTGADWTADVSPVRYGLYQVLNGS